jgi:hypothetical protein
MKSARRGGGVSVGVGGGDGDAVGSALPVTPAGGVFTGSPTPGEQAGSDRERAARRSPSRKPHHRALAEGLVIESAERIALLTGGNCTRKIPDHSKSGEKDTPVRVCVPRTSNIIILNISRPFHRPVRLLHPRQRREPARRDL